MTELRRILRRVFATILLVAAIVLPSVASALSGAPSAEAPPLDAQGDSSFLISTSLAPNVVLLFDNSKSMANIEWHPFFDPYPADTSDAGYLAEYGCDAWDNDVVYDASAIDDSLTYCGNVRTVYDPTGPKQPIVFWDGRYLNWYYGLDDTADAAILNEIATAVASVAGCTASGGSSVFANKYRRTRFEATKQVLLDLLCVAETKNVRFALAAFREDDNATNDDPNGGFIIADLGRANPNQAAETESAIGNLIPNSQTQEMTPLGETLFQIYTYWMSRIVSDLPTSDQNNDNIDSTFPLYVYDKFGNVPASGALLDDGFLFPCEKAFVVIVTDGLPTRDDFDIDPADTAAGFGDFQDLIGDYHLDSAGEDLDEAPAADPEEAAYYLDDIAQFMFENDFRPDMVGDQNIDTYTIGFATDAATDAFLERTANLANGFYFHAKDGDELTLHLLAALNDIIEKAASFTAASVPSARTADGADFYQSYFFPRGKSAFWEGHIRAWHITASGAILDKNGDCALDDPTPGECDSGPFLEGAEFFWDAAEEVPQPDETVSPTRTLYMSKASLNTFGALPPVFNQTNVLYTDLDLGVFTNPNQVPSDSTPNDVLYPLLGSTAYNEEGLADEIVAAVRGCFFGTGVVDLSNVDGADPCAERPALLGDVFHSNAAVVRGPSRFVFDDASYNLFKDHYFTRDRVLYAGTNAGFLEAIHAGDWDTGLDPDRYDEGTGLELWGFMPWEARFKVKNLPIDNATSRTHYVDGDTQTADVWFYPTATTTMAVKAGGDGNDWHTLLAGSLREGGFHYYALDITNPSAFSPVGGLGSPLPYPGYLWEFPDESNTGSYQQWVGETWGKPIITRVKLDVNSNVNAPFERWVVIVTGGYHDTADPNPTDVTGLASSNYDATAAATSARSIFMLDAKTGEVIAMKRYVDGSGTAEEDMKYAVVAKPSVIDLNSDGFADIIYFVDMGGQVFKWVINAVGEDRVNDFSGDPTDQPNWPFKLFFKTNNPDTSPTPDNTRISGTDYYLNLFFSPAVAYSGGQLWLAFGTGERRSLAFEGVTGTDKENNRYYVVSDADPYEFSALPTLEESDLMDLTSDEDGANVTGRGFFFKIGDGEKFVTNTEIFAGHVIAGTFKPEDTGDPCTSRGSGTLYVFDLLTGEGYFDDGGGNPTRGLDIGAGLPTDPQVSVGVGGEDNKVIIEKSGTDILEIDEEDINASGGLLYWREKL